MEDSSPNTDALGTAGPAGPAPRRTKLLRRLRRYVFLAAAIYSVFCVDLAWETVRPKNSRIETSPSSLKLPFERVSFTSADGTRLSGWYIPAPVASKNSERGVVVLCHGVDCDRTAMLSKAQLLNRRGFATLLFDFRGRGESGPALCTIGYREVDDLLAAVHYLRARPDSTTLPIGVFGESQGAAVAIMGTARSPEIMAVAAESPFARLDHAVDNHFRKVMGASAPILEVPVRLIGQSMIHRRCRDVSPVDEIPRVAPRSVLLIQDGADELCPPSETAQLLAAAGPKATLWTVPGADHIEAILVDPAGFDERVSTFFINSLCGAHKSLRTAP